MSNLPEKTVSIVSPCPDTRLDVPMHANDEQLVPDIIMDDFVPHKFGPELSQKPCYWLFKSENQYGPPGVYFFNSPKSADRQPQPLWVCSPLEVQAQCRTPESNEWGKLLVWQDPDGQPKEWAMPNRLLGGEPKFIISPLLAGGLQIARKKHLIDYISKENPSNRVVSLEKTGWAKPGVYILPNSVVDETTDSDIYKLLSEARPEPDFSRGTLESWREHVASLCLGNSRLLFAVSAAFAGPLLQPCGYNGGGFHFIGSSSIGKSLSMLMAASVMDDPERAVITWRATDNGLESIASRHNDGLLMLDELGQVDGRKAGEIAYMLANGTGKTRAQKDGQSKKCLTWRLVFLSNGEIDLSQLMTENGKRTMAGQEVRMVTIPADAGKGFGIFENLHGLSDSKAMADKVRLATQVNHGTAFVPYLQYIAKNHSILPAYVKSSVSLFIRDYCKANSDGQVMRVAERFGIVAAAGELATRAGITGWPERAAVEAAAHCFEAWIDWRGGLGSQEEREVIRRLLEAISRDSARFQSVDSEQEPKERLGFKSDDCYYIFAEGFCEIMAGFDAKFAAEVLQKHGIIKHDIGTGLKRVRLPLFKRCRFYCINIEDLPDMT